jgi:DNA-3-methyladenine glycosylase II
MPMRRFRVAENSMLPTLLPGEEFVASSSIRPQVGDVVALPHPDREGFWLVKRMVAGPGDSVGDRRLGADEAWVLSDNAAVTRADSRSLGPLPLRGLWPRVTRLDPTTFAEATQMLADEEPALAAIVDDWGMPAFWQRDPGFPTLVLLILEQQVSLESGAAMYRRLVDLLGVVTPGSVLGVGEAGLTAIGVTRQKAGYLVSLAYAVETGTLDLPSLQEVGEDEARARLQAMKGIGAWTADAYLLAALLLPDVFPLGDRALQVGVAEALGLEDVPGADGLEIVSAPWRPVRAVAARLVWHLYLSRRGRSEPVLPVT